VSDPLPESLSVAYVLGVTPGKWARIWSDRMPRNPLDLQLLDDPLGALTLGTADAALVRLGPLPSGAESAGSDVLGPEMSAIELYREAQFVIAPKGHAIETADSVALAELEGETVLEGDGVLELVAANVGVAIVPQSVARALSRRDVIARPVTDAAETAIALAWPTAKTTQLLEEFIGILRGRTANSSRGVGGSEPPTDARPAKTVTRRPARRKSPQPKRGKRRR
jgi:DNA-binding transcriptional LysR family regulator